MTERLPDQLRDIDPRLLTASVRPARPLTTKEGWRDFMKAKPIPTPPLVPRKVTASWSVVSQARYKAIRKRFHAMQTPLSTPALHAITKAVQQMALTGIDLPPGVRPGALINGMPTLGKSTIVTEIGRQYERTLYKRLGLEDDEDPDDEFIPVVYSTLMSNETNKGLTARLLDYYGHPYNPNDTETALGRFLARRAETAGSTLIIVDDIHFLNPAYKQGLAVNTHLKALASSISATFLYAGVNVQGTGLLYEGKEADQAQASQTQRRFRRMDVHPFACDGTEFIGVLKALEKRLALQQGEVGDVVNLADYIHDRTDGYIGPITTLIREGAAVAIDTGAERISRTILDLVVLDHASQKRSEWLRSTAAAEPRSA